MRDWCLRDIHKVIICVILYPYHHRRVMCNILSCERKRKKISVFTHISRNAPHFATCRRLDFSYDFTLTINECCKHLKRCEKSNRSEAHGTKSGLINFRISCDRLRSCAFQNFEYIFYFDIYSIIFGCDKCSIVVWGI